MVLYDPVYVFIELAHARQWPAQRSFARPLLCNAGGCCSARLRSAQKALNIEPEWSPNNFKIYQMLLPDGLLAPLGLQKAS